MSERRLCTVYIPSGRRYTGAKRHDITSAQGPVGVSKAAIGARAPVLLSACSACTDTPTGPRAPVM